MKGRLRRLLIGLRWRALVPVSGRLEVIEGQLDGLGRRLDEIEALIETLGARTATATERSNEIVESHARIARRVEEIEAVLGARPPAT